MILEVDINLLYLFILQRYVVVVMKEHKLCNCLKENYQLPIPVKKDRTKLFTNGVCCSFECLINFLNNAKYFGDMKYNYSLNIIWSILPFFMNQTNICHNTDNKAHFHPQRYREY